MRILILWDQFGEAPMTAYLITPKDKAQSKRLLSMHEHFINSTKTPQDNPVYAFNELLCAEEKTLERFKITWPVVLREPVIMIHTGFLP